MITDKFKGYNEDGVKVSLYQWHEPGFSLATISNAAGEAVVNSVGGRFKLVINANGWINTSYWTQGDSAIQTAIDSLVQRSWAL